MISSESSYQAASNEQHRDRNVLQVTGLPIAIFVAKVLEKDVARTVQEDQSAFDKLGR